MSRSAAWAAVGLFVLAAAAPCAMAYPKPALYFLGDSPDGLTADGNLLLPQAGLIPNTTSPSLRPVPAFISMVQPARFATLPGAEHPERIKGYLYVGIWTGASPILHGNLSATLSELTSDGKLVKLGSASVALDANTSKLPEPTALVPPNPEPDPNDPQGWATSVVFYEAFQLTPAILQPPTLLKLGIVDLKVNATSQVVIDFAVAPAESGFNGLPALPVPMGAAATLQYNYTLNPSFVYVPWYAPDPVAPGKTPTKAPAASSHPPTASANPAGGASSPASPSQKSPGLGVGLMAVALAAVALALARRR